MLNARHNFLRWGHSYHCISSFHLVRYSHRLQVGGKVEEAAEKVERKGQDVKKDAQ